MVSEVSSASRESDLGWLLRRLVEGVPHTRSAVLLSADGLPTASHGLAPDLADQMSAIASGLFSLARTAAVRFGDGDGVRQVVAPSAVGSLVPAYGPGTLTIPDQVVDRTNGRTQTYYDDGAVHVSFSDPYCPAGRKVALETAREAGWQPVDGGTLVVIEGPRFSTRAESRWFAAQGWTLVGMTGLPEAALARELALCYIPACLVTDLDAGVEEGTGVTHEEVLRVFAQNVGRLRDLVAQIVAALPADRDCPCPHTLDGLKLPLELP